MASNRIKLSRNNKIQTQVHTDSLVVNKNEYLKPFLTNLNRMIKSKNHLSIGRAVKAETEHTALGSFSFCRLEIDRINESRTRVPIC